MKEKKHYPITDATRHLFGSESDWDAIQAFKASLGQPIINPPPTINEKETPMNISTLKAALAHMQKAPRVNRSDLKLVESVVAAIEKGQIPQASQAASVKRITKGFIRSAA